MAPLVRTGGSRHTGLAAPPHHNIQILAKCEAGYGAYSNSIIVDEPNRERVYIHSSHAYADNKTNILAWWVDKI